MKNHQSKEKVTQEMLILKEQAQQKLDRWEKAMNGDIDSNMELSLMRGLLTEDEF